MYTLLLYVVAVVQNATCKSLFLLLLSHNLRYTLKINKIGGESINMITSGYHGQCTRIVALLVVIIVNFNKILSTLLDNILSGYEPNELDRNLPQTEQTSNQIEQTYFMSKWFVMLYLILT